ncbi:protein kinase C-binding protein NELL1-like isoform X2 [Artemia franciscana]|uniref:protein kinase C-binding protein NELL1-like isoform X2 n=1 Tax=Artemia franciscana TaxID=6661 RepID=UPI0032DB7FBD
MNFGVFWMIMWIISFLDEAGCSVLGEFTSVIQVDLLRSLGLFNKNSSNSLDGVSVTSGPYGSRPALKLFGERRKLRVPDHETHRVLDILRTSSDFTFLAHVKQQELNAGVLISYSEDFSRYFELQSSGRKDELRLHYLHNGHVFVESFPYRLSDGRWHRLALTVSDSEVTVFVDCQQIYQRVIRSLDKDSLFLQKNASLWIGQRGDDHFLFQGSLQEVRIVSGPNGHLLQCPGSDSSCPTCGQFSSLQLTVSKLENYVKELARKLEDTEHRLRSVEECECRKSCTVNSTVKADGDQWKDGCDTCTCQGGEVRCTPIACPVTNCKNPVRRLGECCPVCLKKCVSGGVWYDHGDREASRGCKVTECRDGVMRSVALNPAEVCPPLPCPPSEQVSKQGECCKFCVGADYCRQGHECHGNASCINLRTEFLCQCNPGFYGDGKNCTDIDECTTLGGKEGHHCGNNTICVNSIGSYTCQCIEGYAREDNFTCSEIDECAVGLHNCDANAHCTNIPGGYKCDCTAGYEGDGKYCKPICSQPCQNGGFCRVPEQCSCRSGFTGQQCEFDLDECALNMHKCGENSECVNKYGWYDCKCKKGYRSFASGDNSTVSCIDVDECAEGTHTCQGDLRCVNTEGGFNCQCGDTNSTCRNLCDSPHGPKPHLSVWLPSEPCTVCSCDNGVTQCQSLPCSCDVSQTETVFSLELQLVIENFLANRKIDKSCCRRCDFKSSQGCTHQKDKTRILRSGEVWIHHCQTCECLNGEIDCWSLECPPVFCDSPVLQPGDCCPRCRDDPCSPMESNITDSLQGCHYGGDFYSSGMSWTLLEDPCTTCSCKDGHSCCRFNPTCALSTGASFHSDFKHSAIKKAIKDITRKSTNSPDRRLSKNPEEVMLSVHERRKKYSKTEPPRYRRNTRFKRQGVRARRGSETKKRIGDKVN